MQGRAESLDILVRHVQPFVIPCPRAIVLDALQYVAGDFFTATGIWMDVIEDVLLPGQRELEVVPQKGAELVDVRAILCNGVPVNRDQWALDWRTVRFDSCNNATPLHLLLEVFLRPSRYAECIPARFVEEWGDVIAQGALARLKSMSGAKVEWTDMNGAAIALDLYNQGVSRARGRQFHATRSLVS